MANRNKKEELSLDEEMLMWTSYRYCIGRKTYVSSLAPYIGKKYYPLMNDGQRERTAIDIRERISDCLRFCKPAFEYDGTIDRDERIPLVDFVMWLNSHVSDTKDLYNIEKIVCYKDGYGEKYEKRYDVHTRSKEWTHIFESDIEDFLIWETLASLMDVKRHKNVTVNFNGEIKTIKCFETVEKQIEPIEDKEGYYRRVEWKWRKCYKSIDSYLNDGEHCGSLNEKYIIKIEDEN